MNLLLFLSSLILGCLTVFSRADQPATLVQKGDSIIKTNEEEPGAGIILEPGKLLLLQCNITEADLELEIHWEKDGRSISNEDGFVIDPVNRSLSVKAANEKNHTGTYVCIAATRQNDKRANATIIVTTRPGVEQFHKSLNLVQGDKLVLTCTFSGVPSPNITWWKDNMMIAGDNETGLKFVTNYETRTSVLTKEELDYDDRAEYTCQASINGDSANTTILVRVKDRLAALWPFLGICAEVAILCTIIFVYEKKRSKPEFDEADNENNPENKNIPDQKEGTQDVRQRK